LATIEEHRVTGVMLVPTMIHLLMTHPLLAKADLSSLRYLLYGASPMPEETMRRAMRTLPRCQFFQGYGQTELSPVATMLTSAYNTFEGVAAGKLTSAGRATSCCDMGVVDPKGLEVARDTVGEIRVRGFNTML
jgi:acyl-CoA synthetase (AMP-forming)/AMP-acid ligase II